MKLKLVLLIIAVSFFSFLVYAETSYEEGVLLIGLKEEFENLPNDVYLVVNGYGGKVEGGKCLFPGVFKLTFPSDVNLEEVKRELEKLETVDYVEYNYKFKIKSRPYISFGISTSGAITPNDPNYLFQWGIRQIQLPEAWEIEEGSQEVKIAILDTGCDLDHPDLKNRIDRVNSLNLLDSSNPPEDNSLNGHGTHIAGIIGAVTDNGVGIAGVTWKPRLVIIKIADMYGDIIMDKLAQGIYKAANIPGVKVINMSLGGPTFSNTVYSAVKRAYNKGIVLVAAAGNDRSSSKYIPAGYEEVIGVTATDENDRPCYTFFAFDPTTGTNYNPPGKKYYTIAAPGKNIYSTLPGGKYGFMDGTSMASAFVSGVAGLLVSKDSELTPDKIRKILEENSDPIVDEEPAKDIGEGRVNAYKALLALEEEEDNQDDNNEQPKEVKAVAWVGERGKKRIEVNSQELVQFYGDDSQGPEGVNLQYLWVFDDPQNPFSTQPNPTHIYNLSKEYKVKLVVLTESDLDDDEVTVVVKGGQPFTPPKAIIQGKVKDKSNNNPIAGAKVKISSKNVQALSENDGSYRLEVEVKSPGEILKLRVEKQGYRSRTKLIYVKPGATRNLDFILRPGEERRIDFTLYGPLPQ